MKTKIAIAALLVSAFIIGCTTVSQRATYNTIATVEQTATLAVDDYYGLVIKGTVSTNGVPSVSKAFNDLQAAGMLAAVTAQQGTNALAPASLVLEASQLGTLITTLETTKP
jgi:hypothetical protein